MKKILVINGPNLNLLGKREPKLYGKESLKDINLKLEERASKGDIKLEFYQSNHEGDLVSYLQKLLLEDYSGAILNAAAYTHTSIALRDAILACEKPVIEVHLTNPNGREGFRQNSMLAGAVIGAISGFGSASYVLALEYFLNLFNSDN